jgi:hypothetical protein
MTDLPSVARVPASRLREIFNTQGFQALIDSGALLETVEAENAPSPASGQPSGTLSQLLAYRNSEGRIVLRVHRYLRSDGTLGGSGKPDPKYILHEDTIYKQGDD